QQVRRLLPARAPLPEVVPRPDVTGATAEQAKAYGVIDDIIASRKAQDGLAALASADGRASGRPNGGRGPSPDARAIGIRSFSCSGPCPFLVGCFHARKRWEAATSRCEGEEGRRTGKATSRPQQAARGPRNRLATLEPRTKR